MTELQQLVDKSISDRKLNYFDFDHLYRFSFWSVKMSCFTLSRVVINWVSLKFFDKSKNDDTHVCFRESWWAFFTFSHIFLRPIDESVQLFSAVLSLWFISI